MPVCNNGECIGDDYYLLTSHCKMSLSLQDILKAQSYNQTPENALVAVTKLLS